MEFSRKTKLVRKIFSLKGIVSFGLSQPEGDFSFNLRTGMISHEPPDIEYMVEKDLLVKAFSTYTFTNIDISKLWTVKVHKELFTHFLFTSLYSLYEHGYFNIDNWFSLRFLKGWFFRRWEIWDYLRMVITSKLSGKSIADQLLDK